MKYQRVAIYVRVSTDLQTEGYSIDEQIVRLRKYCEANDWIIYDQYVDPGYSGGSLDRPGLKRLISDIDKIDTVLVYKLDRLSRSQKDILYMIEDVFLANGVNFVSMTETLDTSSSFGKAMIGILSVFAQLEREQIKERMSLGRVGRARSGKWRGGSNVPIGYKFIDGELIVDPYEALQVREIFRLFLEGESMHSIRSYMSEHYTNKFSNYAHPSIIGKILQNKLYIGMVHYKDTFYPGIHEPIIDQDTFNRAQIRYAEISSKNDRLYRSPFKGSHLLTGLLFCENCGARYFTWTCRRKGAKMGERYAYYKCYSRDANSKMKKIDGCKNPTYPVAVLERVILDEIRKLKFDPHYLDAHLSDPMDHARSEELAVLEKKAKELTDQITRLTDLYTLGLLPVDDLSARIKKINEDKSKIETNIEQIKEEDQKRTGLSRDEILEILDHFDEDIYALELKDQRAIVQALISKIIIGREKNSITIHWKFT